MRTLTPAPGRSRAEAVPIIGNHVAVNSGRWRLAVVAFAVSVIGVLIWLATSEDALDVGDKLASVTGAVLALAGLVVGLLTLRAGVAADTSGDPAHALEDLADLVLRQWEREAGARGLTHQDPLDVRWASTRRPVAPSAKDVIGPGVVPGEPLRLKLHGGVGRLADALFELPGHQLVLLGEPGSGKTSAAMLLVLDLLARREPGDLVPVLLPLASWDPAEQDLDSWMAQRISADHPDFRARGVHGQALARALVEKRLVLPVLDALDEVGSKVDAVRGIARVVGRNSPFVLTCRADDYEEIIRETGVPVGRAAVVELTPVGAREAARYLEAGVLEGDRRWRPVTEALLREPDGVLARALSTPLAVYLARTAFTPLTSDPADLLELPTSSAVEKHLLEAYLPALYPSPENPRRWLAFLARRLAARPQARNLGWWRLFLMLPGPRTVVGASRGLLTGAVFATTILLHGRLSDQPVFAAWWLVVLVVGAAAGAVAGALAGTVAGAVRAPDAARLPSYLVASWGRAAGGLLAGGLAGIGASALADQLASARTPLGIVVTTGSIIGIGWSSQALAKPISVNAPVDPRGGLAGDRKATIFVTALATTTITVGLSMWTWVEGGLDVPALVAMAGLGLTASCVWPLSGAWVGFTIARTWFALCGRLPWRLLGFLEEAHERGVLRQVGAAYEFRHQRLQQHFSR
ncbi:hypothetical protein [Lentzea sp. HUAS12]|uniref:hypothetical protein n=1 Tax=Lentzea sp. HUAS12 TaxID=2951806 RepID=UPI0020A17A0D|nr:hypothetical protein [Lentzea sp. HUAS12]USX56475.1 hypothetical protein ND450_20960 [Lentzea sp. HUAS12]